MHLDIVRSHQKDAFYVETLRSLLGQSVTGLSGNRQILFRNAMEISLSSALIYYGMLTMRGYQTLGEEYCEILPVHNFAKPSFGRRLVLSVLDALPASALQHIKSLIAHVFSGEQFATTFENIYDQIITPLNLAVFYYSGRYYQLSKRIVGIDYVYQSKYILPRPKKSYNLLALLLAVQISLRISKLLLQHKSMKETPHTVDEQSSHKTTCVLCLYPRKNTSVTSCGHLFCWDCIMGWTIKSGQSACPVCRQSISPSHIVLLKNA